MHTTPYQPVDPDFHVIAKDFIDKARPLKVHFFDPNGQIDDASGIPALLTKQGNGWFVQFENQLIRLDTIITIGGRPGPAYSRYEQFGNACLACEDLGQFY